jgi:DNA repair protein RadA/Sms
MCAVALKPPARSPLTCSACGLGFAKWAGRCPACGEWNSLVESRSPLLRRPAPAAPAGVTIALEAVTGSASAHQGSGLAEIDRVLGGGLVPGSVVLLGGDPGIGKSTLALQVAQRCGSHGAPSLYCSGEESADQLGLRARRVGCATSAIHVLIESDLDSVLATVESLRPPLAVIDSVQTLLDPTVAGSPGSPAQVRGAVARVAATAKATGVPVMLIGHVTKDGAIAGPRTLEHMVDVVLYLEGDRLGDQRLLRGIKNRFGSTGEVGLLAMDGEGMREVEVPGRAFLDGSPTGGAGSVLTITCDGVRPLAVEVQALAVRAATALPRRTASGIDLNRLHMLIAVLEKRGGFSLGQSDVFLNAAGGLRLNDPAVDLPAALAVAGSARCRSLPPGWAAIGEVGLGGEVRRVARVEARLAEAAVAGITDVVMPALGQCRVPPGLRCHRVATVTDSIAMLV